MSNELYLIVSYFAFAILCFGLGLLVFYILRRPFERVAESDSATAQDFAETRLDAFDDRGVRSGISRCQLQPAGVHGRRTDN